MPSRGRPRRPPRTDREEIKRNSDQWDEKVQAGLDAIFPIEPRPHPLTVEEIKSLFHAPSEKDLAAAAEKAHAAPAPPPTESELTFDRELTEQLRDAGAPLPPSWVLDAVCEAFAAELDITAARASIDEAGLEAMRTLKEVMSERIRDPGGLGVQVRLSLYLNGKERFRAFVATFPTPDDYQDTFLGVSITRLTVIAVGASSAAPCSRCARRPKWKNRAIVPRNAPIVNTRAGHSVIGVGRRT